MSSTAVFDNWPEKYDRWFQTPIGRRVYAFERRVILASLGPLAGQVVLDAGCGTGVFTRDFIRAGAYVVGLELSRPMLCAAAAKLGSARFQKVQGDMRNLPFRDGYFDKAVSITALEFIAEGRRAVDELFRVTRPGGIIAVATLNRLSPWAFRRRKSARRGHAIFRHAVFRAPADLLRLADVPGEIRSAVHFDKDVDAAWAPVVEAKARGRDTGAFLVARWQKPE